MKIIEFWIRLIPEDFSTMEVSSVMANWIAMLSQSSSPTEKTWAKYFKKLWEVPSDVSLFKIKIPDKRRFFGIIVFSSFFAK